MSVFLIIAVALSSVALGFMARQWFASPQWEVFDARSGRVVFRVRTELQARRACRHLERIDSRGIVADYERVN